MLLFVDESEALTHPYLARAWAKRGADLRVPAPGQAKKIAMMGALDHAARRLVVHTSKTKRSADFRTGKLTGYDTVQLDCSIRVTVFSSALSNTSSSASLKTEISSFDVYSTSTGSPLGPLNSVEANRA